MPFSIIIAILLTFGVSSLLFLRLTSPTPLSLKVEQVPDVPRLIKELSEADREPAFACEAHLDDWFIRTLKSKYRASDTAGLEEFVESLVRVYNRTPHVLTKMRAIDVKAGMIPVTEAKMKDFSNIQQGERLFELTKPLVFFQYDFKRLPLKRDEIRSMVRGIATVTDIIGNIVTIRRPDCGTARIPSQLLRKPRRPLLDTRQVVSVRPEIADVLLECGGLPGFENTRKRSATAPDSSMSRGAKKVEMG